MKIESKSAKEGVDLTQAIDYSCSELNTTIHFPDFELRVKEKTLTNSDRHLKRRKQELDLRVRPKELLRERIKLEISFLRNKLKIFSLQTEGKLDHQLKAMTRWMDQAEGRLREDEQNEGKLATQEIEKSFLGDPSASINVLEQEK